MTDPNGNVINHTYNHALRLTRKDITRANGVIGVMYEVFGYDGASRMTLAENNDSKVWMRYDCMGNLLEEQQQIGSQSVKSVVSQYDVNGFPH